MAEDGEVVIGGEQGNQADGYSAKGLEKALTIQSGPGSRR